MLRRFGPFGCQKFEPDIRREILKNAQIMERLGSMTSDESKAILLLYRSGTADGRDPEIATTIEQTEETQSRACGLNDTRNSKSRFGQR